MDGQVLIQVGGKVACIRMRYVNDILSKSKSVIAMLHHDIFVSNANQRGSPLALKFVSGDYIDQSKWK
jgi:phage gp16-like protein